MREKLPKDLAKYARRHRCHQYFSVDNEGFYRFRHYWSDIVRVHPTKKIIEFGYNYHYSALTTAKLGEFLDEFAPWFRKQYKGVDVWELIESGEFDGLCTVEITPHRGDNKTIIQCTKGDESHLWYH